MGRATSEIEPDIQVAGRSGYPVQSMDRPVVLMDPNEAQEDRNEALMAHMHSYFGKEKVVPVNLPTDFGFYVGGQQRLIERKVCPQDFLSSIKDRLRTQGLALAETGGALVLEGKFEYARDGRVLVNGYPRDWTIYQITGILMSLEDAGIKILYSPSVQFTPHVLHEAYRWFSKTGTSFISRRPRPRYEWGAPTLKERVLYAFQGFGMGAETARKAWRHCKTLREMALMDEKELTKIPGVGPARAKTIMRMFDTEFPQEKKGD
jgi:ERCC4-type nuclease